MTAEIPPANEGVSQPENTSERSLIKYDQFQHDALHSGELLDLIHEQNERELYESGFALHFIDALKDISIDPGGRIFVSQQFSADSSSRIVQAILAQPDKYGKRTRIMRTVGYEKEGNLTPKGYFDEHDLRIALAQLRNLQLMKDMGMISLDRSLSIPVRAQGM